MILKVEDALKPFSRTPARLCHSRPNGLPGRTGGDPDCETYRVLWVIFPTACHLHQSFSDGAL